MVVFVVSESFETATISVFFVSFARKQYPVLILLTVGERVSLFSEPICRIHSLDFLFSYFLDGGKQNIQQVC